jgi:hypothetical protein
MVYSKMKGVVATAFEKRGGIYVILMKEPFNGTCGNNGGRNFGSVVAWYVEVSFRVVGR